MPRPDSRTKRTVRAWHRYAVPDRLPPAGSRRGQIERWRRLLGLQYPRRQIVLLRRPVRVVLYLSRKPSLSIRGRGLTLNVNEDGVGSSVRAGGVGKRFNRVRWARLREARSIPPARRKKVQP